MKKLKLAIAIAAALTLCMSSFAVTTFAVLNDKGALIAVDPDHPAEAAITKMLKMPIGTDKPTATFEFLVDKVSVEGKTTSEAKATMPTIGMDGVVTISTAAALEKNTRTENGITYVAIESQSLFAGKNFPRAGVYVYEITETEKTNAAIDSNTDHESLSYSGAKYTITLYVKSKEAPATGTYIYAIGTRVTLADSGSAQVGEKVDPTPGGTVATGEYSKMIFTNVYVKTNGPDDPDTPDPEKEEDSTLLVDKTVTGTFGSKEIYFDYEMTVFAPSVVYNGTGTAPIFKAYIVEAGQFLGEDALEKNEISADVTSEGVIYVVANSPFEFSLKDGQRLMFINTPVGSYYEIKELGTVSYTPSVIVTYDGDALAEESGSMSADFAIPSEKTFTIDEDRLYVGEALNKAAFTNDRDSVTPTGLNLNDIPFIGMVLLALGAIAVFVLIKVRSARKARNEA